jgi:hypothetical protein
MTFYFIYKLRLPGPPCPLVYRKPTPYVLPQRASGAARDEIGRARLEYGIYLGRASILYYIIERG